MSRLENVTLTNMCMIYDGSKVLIQDKTDADYHGITFPGGHVEKGESFTDAVIREVWEETGLRICSPVLCGIKDWSNDDGSRYMVLLYKTSKFEGPSVITLRNIAVIIPAVSLSKTFMALSSCFYKQSTFRLPKYMSSRIH